MRAGFLILTLLLWPVVAESDDKGLPAPANSPQVVMLKAKEETNRKWVEWLKSAPVQLQFVDAPSGGTLVDVSGKQYVLFEPTDLQHQKMALAGRYVTNVAPGTSIQSDPTLTKAEFIRMLQDTKDELAKTIKQETDVVTLLANKIQTLEQQIEEIKKTSK